MRKEDKEGIGVALGDGVNCDGVAIAGDAPAPAGVEVLGTGVLLLLSKPLSISSRATSIG